MRHRPVYRGDSWVLGICVHCRRTNYVEPHGVTAMCLCKKGLTTEHVSIPESQRSNGLMGPFVLVDKHSRLVSAEDHDA
jgi:hypothetical protein